MAESERPFVQKSLVLWETGLVRCTCIHGAHDHIEAALTVEGAIVHQEVFTDHGSATEFAIDRMRAYHAV